MQHNSKQRMYQSDTQESASASFIHVLNPYPRCIVFLKNSQMDNGLTKTGFLLVRFKGLAVVVIGRQDSNADSYQFQVIVGILSKLTWVWLWQKSNMSRYQREAVLHLI